MEDIKLPYLVIYFNNNHIAIISKKLSDDMSYSVIDSETTCFLLVTKRSYAPFEERKVFSAKGYAKAKQGLSLYLFIH